VGTVQAGKEAQRELPAIPREEVRAQMRNFFVGLVTHENQNIWKRVLLLLREPYPLESLIRSVFEREGGRFYGGENVSRVKTRLRRFLRAQKEGKSARRRERELLTGRARRKENGA